MTGREPTSELLAEALRELERAERRIAELEDARHAPVAIVGMACRMPGGVLGPDELATRLLAGEDLVGRAPEHRWLPIPEGLDEATRADEEALRQGGFLDDAFRFDPARFGIAPREAPFIDPQHRLLLEVTLEALADTGVREDELRGSRTGVWVGISAQDHATFMAEHLPRSAIEPAAGTGSAHAAAAGRIAHAFGLEGPALALDTACSSSLVALHDATQALRAGRCDLAIVAGVNLLLSPQMSLVFQRARMLSPRGRCATFDAEADGYVRGEGVGVLVLSRPERATREGWRERARVRGVAVNQDGASGGLTVPNRGAQARVIREALADARLEPRDVDAIEAHGTGTSLGDPQELAALTDVFHPGADVVDLPVSSIKTACGHLEAAAGVAGVIKVVLQLEQRRLAPHLHVEHPTPHFPWSEHVLRIPRDVETLQGARSVIGVSSFGFTGTNAHVVLETAAEGTAASPDEEARLPLLLSGQDEAALRAEAEQVSQRLLVSGVPDARTLRAHGLGRSALAFRMIVWPTDDRNPGEQLRSWLTTGSGTLVAQAVPLSRAKRRLGIVIDATAESLRDLGTVLQAGVRPRALVAPVERHDAVRDLLRNHGLGHLALTPSLGDPEAGDLLLDLGRQLLAMGDEEHREPLLRLLGRLWVLGFPIDPRTWLGEGARHGQGLSRPHLRPQRWRLPFDPGARGSGDAARRSAHALIHDPEIDSYQNAPLGHVLAEGLRARSVVSLDPTRCAWLRDRLVEGRTCIDPATALEAAIGMLETLQPGRVHRLVDLRWNTPLPCLPGDRLVTVLHGKVPGGPWRVLVSVQGSDRPVARCFEARIHLDGEALEHAHASPAPDPHGSGEEVAEVRRTQLLGSLEPDRLGETSRFVVHPAIWEQLLVRSDDAEHWIRQAASLEIETGNGNVQQLEVAAGATANEVRARTSSGGRIWLEGTEYRAISKARFFGSRSACRNYQLEFLRVPVPLPRQLPDEIVLCDLGASVHADAVREALIARAIQVRVHAVDELDGIGGDPAILLLADETFDLGSVQAWEALRAIARAGRAVHALCLHEQGHDTPSLGGLWSALGSWALEPGVRMGRRLGLAPIHLSEECWIDALFGESEEEELYLFGAGSADVIVPRWIPGWHGTRTDGPEIDHRRPTARHAVVTGAGGGLASHLLEAWCSWAGAKRPERLTLIVRGEPADLLQARIGQLERSGCIVETLRVDLADRDTRRKAFDRLFAAEPEPDQIFHLAGASADALLANLDPAAALRGWQVKVETAQDLAGRTSGKSFLISAGSAGSVLGSPGQASYAAANAALTASLGFGTTFTSCVALGPIRGAGMAFDEHRMRARGLEPIEPHEAVRALLRSPEWYSMEASIDFPALLTAGQGRVSWRPYERLVQAPSRAEGARQRLVDTLRALDADAAARAIAEFFRETTLRVLAIDGDSLCSSTRWSELGLDSLLALELVTAVSEELELTFEAAALLSLETYGEAEAEILAAHMHAEGSSGHGAVTRAADEELLQRLEDLDEDELQRLLEEEGLDG